MANRKGENPTDKLSGDKLAIASLFIGTVSLLTFTLMLVGALSGIVLGLASLVLGERYTRTQHEQGYGHSRNPIKHSGFPPSLLLCRGQC
jgi:hypothetical protein